MAFSTTEESFYSDFPELTETGVYALTPQTDETTTMNIFLQIGEKKSSGPVVALRIPHILS